MAPRLPAAASFPAQGFHPTALREGIVSAEGEWLRFSWPCGAEFVLTPQDARAVVAEIERAPTMWTPVRVRGEGDPYVWARREGTRLIARAPDGAQAWAEWQPLASAVRKLSARRQRWRSILFAWRR